MLSVGPWAGSLVARFSGLKLRVGAVSGPSRTAIRVNMHVN
jgi:hypothetical protein